MPYIPEDWVRNKNNYKEIEFIMNYLEQDLITPDIAEEKARLIEHLDEIGEDIIYKKIKDSDISFGP